MRVLSQPTRKRLAQKRAPRVLLCPPRPPRLPPLSPSVCALPGTREQSKRQTVSVMRVLLPSTKRAWASPRATLVPTRQQRRRKPPLWLRIACAWRTSAESSRNQMTRAPRAPRADICPILLGYHVDLCLAPHPPLHHQRCVFVWTRAGQTYD